MRCSTPGIRTAANGETIREVQHQPQDYERAAHREAAELLRIRRGRAGVLANVNGSVTPMMKTKLGNTTSASVAPFQWAWTSGE